MNELKLKVAKQSVSSQQGWTTVCAAVNSKKNDCSLAGLSELFLVYSVTTQANNTDHPQQELPRKQIAIICGAHLECTLLSHHVQYTFNKLITPCSLGYFIAFENIF